jgi:hypothetical protein
MNSAATGSVIGYVAGATFLGAAVVSAAILTPWRSRPIRGARVVPSFGGVVVVGQF